LTRAFSKYLPDFEIVPSQGGSGAWIKGPESLNSQSLADLCATRGVLIEPGDIFFSKSSNKNQAYFRLGYSAIHGSLIDAGVREIQQAYKDMKIHS
jgi:GntR family transcriptional regulator/MocR family aminotransferase